MTIEIQPPFPCRVGVTAALYPDNTTVNNCTQ